MPSPFMSTFAQLNGDSFPDPFLDMGSLAMPRGMKTALELCHFLFYQNDILRQATRRLVSYFITDLEIGGEKVGSDEQQKWRELTEEVGLLNDLRHALLSRQCYGNSFLSLIRPFKRSIKCSCGTVVTLREAYSHKDMAWAWDQQQLKVLASCPKCLNRTKWQFQDDMLQEPEKLKLKQWNPLEMEIVFDPLTEDSQHIWVPPQDYRRAIREGKNLWMLERVTETVLDTVRDNADYLFFPDALMHIKESVLPGMRTMGWGISGYLTSFRQAIYVQVLRRANEVIGMDYVMPVRLVMPEPGPGGTQASRDPLMGNPHELMSFIRSALRRHRRDPAGWYTVPFPVRGQFLGGNAQMIAPKDLLDQGQSTFLAGQGIPVDFYQGTLRADAGAIGLRLLESDNRDMVYDANRLLRWWVRHVSRVLGWREVPIRLKRVTLADNAERIMMLLQLMSAQNVSLQTGLSALGLDVKTEERQKAEEVLMQNEIQEDLQKKMEQAGMADQMLRVPSQAGGQAGPPGGDPSGGGGGGDPSGGQPGGSPLSPGGGGGGMVQQYLGNSNVARDPKETLALAESIATMLSNMPEPIKNSEMRQLKQRDEVLHSVVTKKMEQLRGQQSLYGRQMIQQQQGQQGSP